MCATERATALVTCFYTQDFVPADGRGESPKSGWLVGLRGIPDGEHGQHPLLRLLSESSASKNVQEPVNRLRNIFAEVVGNCQIYEDAYGGLGEVREGMEKVEVETGMVCLRLREVKRQRKESQRFLEKGEVGDHGEGESGTLGVQVVAKREGQSSLLRLKPPLHARHKGHDLTWRGEERDQPSTRRPLLCVQPGET
ncbi:hypothetical protein BT69DRAFT_1384531 [Atractiella rhizophila]|nr:hypothetical protein BT69DRAFT_1384531 [Atractiella rhizophila]